MADSSAELRLTPTAPGGRDSARAAGPAGIASGEPVVELPPMVEMIGFDEALAAPNPDQRPPRRSFLRPPALAGDAQQMTPLEIPLLIEPTAERPSLRESIGRWVAPLRSLRPPSLPRLKMPAVRLPSRPQWRTPKVKLPNWPQWRAPAVELPAWRMPRPKVLAAGAAAVVIVIAAVAIVARVHPFAPSAMPVRDGAPPPGNPADRLAFYQSAAEGGNSDAQLQLAILYAKGEGVPQDYIVAAKWFRAAADHGSARAQYDLGVLYERGRGVPVDVAEAAKWYLKAAEGKYPLAQFNLAVCYTKGQGVRKDLSEAALWYRRAALQGVVQAMINLGTMYERGDGVPASPVDAYAWYLAASRRGNEAAAKRADEIFAALPKLDQIRAEALAADVAGSIHEYSPAAAAAPQPAATPATAH
jgi:hypothetical protein